MQVVKNKNQKKGEEDENDTKNCFICDVNNNFDGIDRVRLSNEYGSDVIATVYWQHKNKSGSFFDKKTSVILPAKISMGLKAPISGYRAFKIEVVPASNQVLRVLEVSAQFTGLGMILTGTGGEASVGIPLILDATLTSLQDFRIIIQQ